MAHPGNLCYILVCTQKNGENGLFQEKLFKESASVYRDYIKERGLFREHFPHIKGFNISRVSA